jgi:hypothetical protein
MNSHADIGLFGFGSGWFDFFLLFEDDMVAKMCDSIG